MSTTETTPTRCAICADVTGHCPHVPIEHAGPSTLDQVTAEVVRALCNVGLRAELVDEEAEDEYRQRRTRRLVRLVVDGGDGPAYPLGNECPLLSVNVEKYGKAGRVVLSLWWPEGGQASVWDSARNRWVREFDDVSASERRPPRVVALDLLRRARIRDYVAAWLKRKEAKREEARKANEARALAEHLAQLAGPGAAWIATHYGSAPNGEEKGCIRGAGIDFAVSAYKGKVELKIEGLLGVEAEALMLARLAQLETRGEWNPEEEDQDEDTQEQEDTGAPEGPEEEDDQGDDDAGQADDAEWNPPDQEDDDTTPERRSLFE